MSEIPDLERARDLAYSVNSGVYQHQKNCADALLDVLAYVAQLQEALRECLGFLGEELEIEGHPRAAEFRALLPPLDKATDKG